MGHRVQERILGPLYLTHIAIPSVLYYLFGYKSKYYSTPWERTADYFGGVTRETGYSKNSLYWSFAELIFGPIVIPLYFIFEH